MFRKCININNFVRKKYNLKIFIRKTTPYPIAIKLRKDFSPVRDDETVAPSDNSVKTDEKQVKIFFT